MKDSYKVLGLNNGATQEQIREAYLKLRKKNHPDLHHQESVEAQKQYSENFREIQTAYEDLTRTINNKTNFKGKNSQNNYNHYEDYINEINIADIFGEIFGINENFLNNFKFKQKIKEIKTYTIFAPINIFINGGEANISITEKKLQFKIEIPKGINSGEQFKIKNGNEEFLLKIQYKQENNIYINNRDIVVKIKNKINGEEIWHCPWDTNKTIKLKFPQNGPKLIKNMGLPKTKESYRGNLIFIFE